MNDLIGKADVVLEFDFGYVVLVSSEPSVIPNENVFGLNRDGEVKWRIDAIPHVYEDSPYINILKEGEFVRAVNWDGGQVFVRPRDGTIESTSYSK